ncbi:hypothetical protein JTB14_016384 [Gonioctena quinquepunctata]|nr:hypothetical protein JTB14_016384 [Gonioctena quinquepunctata]
MKRALTEHMFSSIRFQISIQFTNYSSCGRQLGEVGEICQSSLDSHPQREGIHKKIVNKSIVNSRPLVHVFLEAEDDGTLTSNDFPIGLSSPAQAPGSFSENDIFSRKQCRVTLYFAVCFWKRWLREYIITLNRRTKYFTKNSRDVKIIILIDGDLSRNCCPRRRVIAIYPGKDGHVRTVSRLKLVPTEDQS